MLIQQETKYDVNDHLYYYKDDYTLSKFIKENPKFECMREILSIKKWYVHSITVWTDWSKETYKIWEEKSWSERYISTDFVYLINVLGLEEECKVEIAKKISDYFMNKWLKELLNTTSVLDRVMQYMKG